VLSVIPDSHEPSAVLRRRACSTSHMLRESVLPTLTTWSLLKPFATSTSKNDSTCASRQDHRCKVGYHGAAGGGDNAFSWWGAPPRRRVRRLLPSCGPAQSTSAVQRSGRDVLHPLVLQISLVELTRAVYWCCANLTFTKESVHRLQ